MLNNILNFSHILLRCEYFLGTFFFSQYMFSLQSKRHFTVAQNGCQFYGSVLFLAAVENRCNDGIQIWILRSILWLVLIILFLTYVFVTVIPCRLGANENIQSVVWWCWNFNNLSCISFFTLLCCIHGVDDWIEFLTGAFFSTLPLSPHRSKVLATYLVCGYMCTFSFCHFGSIEMHF